MKDTKTDTDKLREMLAQCGTNKLLLTKFATSEDYYIRLHSLRAAQEISHTEREINDLIEKLEAQ